MLKIKNIKKFQLINFSNLIILKVSVKFYAITNKNISHKWVKSLFIKSSKAFLDFVNYLCKVKMNF